MKMKDEGNGKKVGMTAFGYGKPESFSGYRPRDLYGLFDDPIIISVYIFDTTSKYIKVPNFDKHENAIRFFRQFGVNISESPI